MKRRWRSAVIVLAVVLSVIGVSSGIVRLTATPADPRAVLMPREHLQAHPPEHRTPTIDGAVHPELIDDARAYNLFFRMLSHSAGSVESASLRIYVRRMVLEPRESYERPPTDDEVNALLKIGQDFHARSERLDTRELDTVAGRNATPRAQHVEKRQKLVSQLRQSFDATLGSEMSLRVQRFVNESVKRKIRVFQN